MINSKDFEEFSKIHDEEMEKSSGSSEMCKL